MEEDISFRWEQQLGVGDIQCWPVVADFFNWNRVKIRYCDGASFAGDGEDKVDFDVLELLKIETMFNSVEAD